MLKILQQIDNFQYLYCPKLNHESAPLNLVCGDSSCPNHSLICIHCQQQNHFQHMTMPVKEYIKKLLISTKVNLQTQNILLLTSNMQKNKNEAITYLENLKHNVNQQIDRIVNELKLQYQMYSSQIKQVYGLRKLLQNLIKIHNLDTDQYKHDQTRIKQTIQNQQKNQQQVYNQNISKMNKINSRLDTILKYAFLEQSMDQSQNSQDPQKKCYCISSLPNKIQLLCNVFKQKWQAVEKMFKKSYEQFETKTFVKSFETLHEKVQLGSKFKRSKFKWTQSYKSNTFSFNGNKVQRTNAAGLQRFVFFDQQLLPYIKKKMKVAWMLKISKLVGWIGIGVCLKQKIIENGFKFKYQNLGHGSYLISSNGYSWSSIQSASNSAYHGFNYTTGDYVVVEFDCTDWKLNFYIVKQSILQNKATLKNTNANYGSNTTKLMISQKYINKSSTLISDNSLSYYIDLGNLQKSHTLTLQENNDYIPCVNLCSLGDGVEIIQ